MSPSAQTTITPKHIAVIMDGNGRWAKQQKRSRYYGHQQGVLAAQNLVKACLEHRIPQLTLFAFSTENWSRPALEVNGLMRLLARGLKQQLSRLQANGVRCRFIGRRSQLGTALLKQLQDAEQATAQGRQLDLYIALDYGGRWDITQACQVLAQRVAAKALQPEQITEALVEEALQMPGGAPDLLIRTGGESRLSNFCLWQCAYTELYFTDIHWPEFDDVAFKQALTAFSQRKRRFGGTLESHEPIAALNVSGVNHA